MTSRRSLRYIARRNPKAANLIGVGIYDRVQILIENPEAGSILACYGNMKTAPPKNIDEYIARFPRDVQKTLQRIREIIRGAAPDAVEAIKYQIPTFVLHGNLVHFAGFQNHIGFYPTPSAIEAFSGELAGFERAKGSVQFPLTKPVPFALIKKMVEFRVKETRKKVTAKKSRK